MLIFILSSSIRLALFCSRCTYTQSISLSCSNQSINQLINISDSCEAYYIVQTPWMCKSNPSLVPIYWPVIYEPVKMTVSSPNILTCDIWTCKDDRLERCLPQNIQPNDSPGLACRFSICTYKQRDLIYIYKNIFQGWKIFPEKTQSVNLIYWITKLAYFYL